MTKCDRTNGLILKWQNLKYTKTKVNIDTLNPDLEQAHIEPVYALSIYFWIIIIHKLKWCCSEKISLELHTHLSIAYFQRLHFSYFRLSLTPLCQAVGGLIAKKYIKTPPYSLPACHNSWFVLVPVIMIMVIFVFVYIPFARDLLSINKDITSVSFTLLLIFVIRSL